LEAKDVFRIVSGRRADCEETVWAKNVVSGSIHLDGEKEPYPHKSMEKHNLNRGIKISGQDTKCTSCNTFIGTYFRGYHESSDLDEVVEYKLLIVDKAGRHSLRPQLKAAHWRPQLSSSGTNATSRTLEMAMQSLSIDATEIKGRLIYLAQLPEIVMQREASGLVLPKYWSQELPKDGKKYTLLPTLHMVKYAKKLAVETSKFEFIGKGRDGNGLDHTGYEIVNAFRVENPTRWQKYAQYRAAVAKSSPEKFAVTTDGKVSSADLLAEGNEKYLFHGTRPELVTVIASEGFDVRNIPSSTSRLFGKGIYFAENWSKSDEYCMPTPNGTYYILVCRVTLGGAYSALQPCNNAEKPPCSRNCPLTTPCDHGRYDSLRAEFGPGAYLQKYREFIVYDWDAAYPEYIIEFRRTKTAESLI
jgi:hypothetical protein